MAPLLLMGAIIGVILGAALAGGSPVAAMSARAATPTPAPTPPRFGPPLDSESLARVLTAPIQLRVVSSTAVLTLTTAALQKAVVTDTTPLRGYTSTTRLDPARLAAALAPLAAKVKTTPTDATVALVKGKPAVITETLGWRLDLTATTTSLVTEPLTPTRVVTATLRPVTTTITTKTIAPFVKPWAALLTAGFTYHAGDKSWTVSGRAFAANVRLAPTTTGSKPGFELDGVDTALAGQFWAIEEDVNYTPHDTRFRLVGSRITVMDHAAGGQQLDRKATLAAALAAVAAGRYESDLVLITQPSPPDIAPPYWVATGDLLAKSSTSYAGSSPERAHNVELGVALIDGAYVAPGAEFDTNGTLGPLTLAAGFEMGFGIVSDGANVTTVPAEAGGICQVATTLFHSVFWAGLPVTERNHHSYWIAAYGRAPSGLQGLDATIAPPTLNFRWRNTTGHWILVRASAAHGTVNFELWGTSPHWQVQVAAPVITKARATSHSPIYEQSALIPYGETRQVEHAQPGFTSDIHRQVFDASGARIDDWHVQSTYLPAHDRFVMGVKGRSPARRP
jgi:vancomycin resistance protein YoaR